MTDDEVRKLQYIAETGDDENASLAMAKLVQINHTYHWCYDLDYMVICDKNKEYEACGCKHELK